MNPTVRRFLVTVALTLFPAAALAALSEPDESAPRYEAILKIDAHSHVFEDHPDIHALFRRINFRTVNVCVNVSDDHFERMHEIAFDLYRQHPALYPFESTFDLRQRDAADYTKNVFAWLGRTFARGAVGVKIWKDVGLVIKRPDGSFALPDDPLWDPIYAYVAQQGKVLHAHLGEPREAWLPLDQDSPHYNYFAGKGELTYDHRKVEALNLPRHVLEKFYRRNAIKLFKLDAAGQREK